MAVQDNFIGFIRVGLDRLGIKHDAELLNKFGVYYSELRKWSRAYNITALRGEREIALKLFIDSLLYLKGFPEPQKKDLCLLDVGSGGGFPGLVIKTVRPELSVSLLEPSWKRAAFLRHMAGKLRLTDVSVLQGTIEEMSASYKDSRSDKRPYLFDVVLTKALFRTYEFIKKVGGLVAPGGLLILSKGPGYEDELKEVHSKLGDRASDYRIEVVGIDLPMTGITRYFIICRISNMFGD